MKLKPMTEVEYKGRKYVFTWRSIGIFFLMAPFIAISTYLIFEFFWEYTYPPFILPVSALLELITGKDFSYYKEATKYVVSVPGTVGMGFVSACSGIYAYAIYLGICMVTPHNQYQDQNNNIWSRKVKTFLLASLVVFCYNVFRLVITLILYYNGVPFNPMHEYISYTLTFFSVFVFYFISYFWLPEFSLFVIWMKDDLKVRFVKSKSNRSEIKISQHESFGKVKIAKKILVIGTWIVICVILFVLVSVLLV